MATTSMTTTAFAARVLAVGRRVPKAGRVGGKVWVHAAWAVGQFEETLDEFKAKLVEANRARLLDLSRCDLPEAFDSHDVRRSTISHLGATFNFVRVD